MEYGGTNTYKKGYLRVKMIGNPEYIKLYMQENR